MASLAQSPVTVTAVKNILGVASNDVGTLCTSSKINPWSRHKPVHIANAISVDRSTQWWRGTNKDCGLTVPVVSTYNSIPAKYAFANNGWTYSGPNGGSLSPYRLADFGYYNHSATPPFTGWTCSSKVSTSGSITALLLLSVQTSDKEGPGSVEFDDIEAILNNQDTTVGSLSDYKFGIMVCEGSGNLDPTVLGRVVGTNNWQCTYSAASLVQGKTYYVWPFIAQQSMTQGSTDVANYYIPIPNVSAPKAVTVVSKEEADGVFFTVTGSRSSLSVFYTIKVGGTSLNNSSISLRFSTSSFGSTMLAGEQRTTFSDSSVASSGSGTYADPWVITGKFTIGSAYLDKTFVLDTTINTSAYTKRINVMETSIT